MRRRSLLPWQHKAAPENVYAPTSNPETAAAPANRTSIVGVPESRQWKWDNNATGHSGLRIEHEKRQLVWYTEHKWEDQWGEHDGGTSCAVNYQEFKDGRRGAPTPESAIGELLETLKALGVDGPFAPASTAPAAAPAAADATPHVSGGEAEHRYWRWNETAAGHEGVRLEHAAREIEFSSAGGGVFTLTYSAYVAMSAEDKRYIRGCPPQRVIDELDEALQALTACAPAPAAAPAPAPTPAPDAESQAAVE
jgi:hypothetical protein